MGGLNGKTLGLIGAGNMGTCILEGLLARQIIPPSSIYIADALKDKAADLAGRLKARPMDSNRELAEKAEIILLAVKPQDLQRAAADLEGRLNRSHRIISILAGTTVERLKEAFSGAGGYVRAMPNLGARAAQSLTALTSDQPALLEEAEAVFSGCGRTVRLEEKHFDLITALSGSGPAYFFLLMEWIAAKAEANGLDKTTARLVAVQTALGAAQVASQAAEGPDELRRMVTSKGGTTQAALDVLEARGAGEAFSSAFDAAARRSRELREA